MIKPASFELRTEDEIAFIYGFPEEPESSIFRKVYDEEGREVIDIADNSFSLLYFQDDASGIETTVDWNGKLSSEFYTPLELISYIINKNLDGVEALEFFNENSEGFYTKIVVMEIEDRDTGYITTEIWGRKMTNKKSDFHKNMELVRKVLDELDRDIDRYREFLEKGKIKSVAFGILNKLREIESVLKSVI